MRFGSNPKLEARIGRVCLVFARVEQEAGYIGQAADGNWDLAGSTAYLKYSAKSGTLDRMLKGVGMAFPQLTGEVKALIRGLERLQRLRNEWAHSAAVVDVFLLMQETGQLSMDWPTQGNADKVLNSRQAEHADPPGDDDVEAFCTRAGEVADAARKLARAVAQLVDDAGPVTW